MKDLSSESSNLMPIQLQPTGHPINPDLFLVLEQTKSSQVSKSKIINGSTSLHCNFDIEKLHRKLVFDVVNEVLVQKLEHPMILPARKLQGRLPSGQQLLKQLCSEIDQLHTEAFKSEDPDDDEYNILGEEILQQLPVDWNDYRREFPCIVLDIERSIFKDMIDELVCGEASSLKYKSSRRHRQLFAK
ncbi:Protein LONGIFOLIA 1 [Dendrobium catenatum]|uniref:Protein LONGIFOLIA 1 n=2 Tax=Dendrobium catenatum TaxID=906689 RepID=A0A2I0XDN4_9ASPA|nr:Protein LONGIFOLIA 1 [Dendrobium catenatum]